MMNITLKQLRYFQAVAQNGHFGRAAARLSISQPALSVQVRELETTLGTLLFERGGRQIRLTRFGTEFAGRVRDILKSVEELENLARASGDKLEGELRLGVIPTIAPYLLPRIIGLLDRAYPSVEIHIRETVTPRLIEELSEGRLDAAVVALPVSEATLAEVRLFEEPMLLVRPVSEAGRPALTASQIGNTRLLLLEEGHCFRDQALSFCTVGASAGREGFDGSSLSTLVQMVGAGIGITLIPGMAAEIETRSAAVTVDAFPEPQPKRTVGMVWRKTSVLSDRLSEVAETLRDGLVA